MTSLSQRLKKPLSDQQVPLTASLALDLYSVGESGQRVMTTRISSFGQKAAIQASSAPHPVQPSNVPHSATKMMCADDTPRRQAMAQGIAAHSMR